MVAAKSMLKSNLNFSTRLELKGCRREARDISYGNGTPITYGPISQSIFSDAVETNLPTLTKSLEKYLTTVNLDMIIRQKITAPPVDVSTI